MAEAADDDEDLKLVRASAGLLDDLQSSLPKLLWKPRKPDGHRGAVHKHVKRRDLDYVISLVEPFQSEPQLLDTRLKHILPQLVEAYLESLRHTADVENDRHVELQVAVCKIIYVVCKVRGSKVISGFFNNEPRYLEPVLDRLEQEANASDEAKSEWQVPYVLLLWLSHLLLTPFDLQSISPARAAGDDDDLPVLANRALDLGLRYLETATKAQEAASTMLIRLVTRPDMSMLRITRRPPFQILDDHGSDAFGNYDRLGLLRFFAGCTASPELADLIPSIYQMFRTAAESQEAPAAANAVAKRLIIKIFRNAVITSLRSSSSQKLLQHLLTSTDMVQDVIGYLIISLQDRDTPVRFAAAKSLSRIILELEADMSQQIIDAIVANYSGGASPRKCTSDFTLGNALEWHGMTLTLAHILFKRSALPIHLPSIIIALVSALHFEQRTSTGSSIGTNVRDAANFGLWALSRRYTTTELLSLDVEPLKEVLCSVSKVSIVQAIALQLVQAACTDPVGNIRRGASAALQELVGRHPNEVSDGIALVQIVDYQAVGLRRRAMVDVAARVAELPSLHDEYWRAIVDATLGWRGIRSPDVASRQAAADSLAQLGQGHSGLLCTLIVDVGALLDTQLDANARHGVMLSFALLLNTRPLRRPVSPFVCLPLEETVKLIDRCTSRFDMQTIQSEQPVAVMQLLTALCRLSLDTDTSTISQHQEMSSQTFADWLDGVIDRLLALNEGTVQPHISALVNARIAAGAAFLWPLVTLAAEPLCKQVAIDASKTTLGGSSRALALGSLAGLYDGGLHGRQATTAISTLAAIVQSQSVDWRIIGVKALLLAIEPLDSGDRVSDSIAETLVEALHYGLNDYTIDERGDVGSLVRLQAIECTSCVLRKATFKSRQALSHILHSDILRLSLEKLDRVRMAAARCRVQHFSLAMDVTDIASVSSLAYVSQALLPLREGETGWQHEALLHGVMSCAGSASEPVLQASRAALGDILASAPHEQLMGHLTTYTQIMKELLSDSGNLMVSALDLLAFLLDMQIPQRLDQSTFKWRNLLSTVQKAHHKSNDIPKILAAVHVYIGLADITAVHSQVLKKLFGMLKTNPYPRVRVAAAEALYAVTQYSEMKAADWTRAPAANEVLLKNIAKRYVDG